VGWQHSYQGEGKEVFERFTIITPAGFLKDVTICIFSSVQLLLKKGGKKLSFNWKIFCCCFFVFEVFPNTTFLLFFNKKEEPRNNMQQYTRAWGRKLKCVKLEVFFSGKEIIRDKTK
jgi:hypothetical protein